MNAYALSQLDDRALLRDLAALDAQDHTTTAALLAHLAEVDTRKLYLPAAYPTMHDYCVGALHQSEEVAFKRIRAARAARDFPALFVAVAEGRLNLTGVVLLAPHLTSDTADELLAAAAHKSKIEVERLLAQRFPRPDLPVRVQVLSSSSSAPNASEPLDLDPVEPCAPGRVESFTRRPKVTPLSPQRFALQLTMSQSTHDKLRYAQELLSHQLPSGDVAEVLDRALNVQFAIMLSQP